MEETGPGLATFSTLLLGAGDASLLEDTVAAARTHSPQVGALPEEEVRRHVRAMIEAAITALDRGGDVGRADLAAAGRLGSDRARQGVPVAALLDGFQAGRSHIVRMIIERGRAAGFSSDDLLEGVTWIDAIATALEHRMVHAHRIAELELARTTRDSTAQRLRQILHGESVEVPLDPGLRYQCVVSEVSDPAVARLLEPGLAAAGLCGLVDGRLAAVVTRMPALPPDGPPLVVSPPVAPAELPGTYALCRRALHAARGLHGPHPVTGLALGAATAAEPELGPLLAAELLAGLDPGDGFDRELAATALAYLDHGGRIEQTAVALHVHPNTVKYRIRRLRELTGGSVAATGPVAETVRWWWALRSWLDRPA